MLIICSSIASFGAYTPLFFMSQHAYSENYDFQDLVLLQTFLGLSIAFGIVASGSTMNKTFTIAYRKVNISRQYVCQVSIIRMGVRTAEGDLKHNSYFLIENISKTHSPLCSHLRGNDEKHFIQCYIH